MELLKRKKKKTSQTENVVMQQDKKRNRCLTSHSASATPKRLCNDISGQRGQRGRPLFVGGPLVSGDIAWSYTTDVERS